MDYHRYVAIRAHVGRQFEMISRVFVENGLGDDVFNRAMYPGPASNIDFSRMAS